MMYVIKDMDTLEILQKIESESEEYVENVARAISTNYQIEAFFNNDMWNVISFNGKKTWASGVKR